MNETEYVPPRCPHPYGSVEADNWWAAHFAVRIREENDRWRDEERAREAAEESRYGHRFGLGDRRCFYCGTDEAEYREFLFDYRDRPLRMMPICTGPLADGRG